MGLNHTTESETTNRNETAGSQLGQRLSRSLTRNGDNTLTTFREEVAKLGADITVNGNEVAKLHIAYIPSAEADIRFSIAVPYVKIDNSTAICLPIVLEASASDAEAQFDKISNLTMPICAADQLSSDSAVQNISDYLARTLRVNTCAFVPAITYRRDIPVDVESVRAVLMTAEASILNAIEANDASFELDSIRELSRGSVQATAQYNSGDTFDNMGMPHRSDITVTLVAGANRDASEVVNLDDQMTNSVKTIAEVGAYVEPIYTGEATADGRADYFMPMVYLTNVRAIDVEDNITTYLMGLAVMASATANRGWVTPLDKVGLSNESDHNIGALALRDPEVGDILNTKKKENSFDLIVERYIRENALNFSFIHSPGTVNASKTHFLVNAAESDHGRAVLINILDRITDGAFSKYFSDGAAVCSHLSSRFYATYKDADGKLRDAQDLDTLRAYNLSSKDDTEFADAYDMRYSRDIDEGAAVLWSMASQVYNSSLRAHSYSDVYLFNPEFITALVKSFKDCGLTPKEHGIRRASGASTVRGMTGLYMNGANTTLGGFGGSQSGGFGINRTRPRYG